MSEKQVISCQKTVGPRHSLPTLKYIVSTYRYLLNANTAMLFALLLHLEIIYVNSTASDIHIFTLVFWHFHVTIVDMYCLTILVTLAFVALPVYTIYQELQVSKQKAIVLNEEIRTLNGIIDLHMRQRVLNSRKPIQQNQRDLHSSKPRNVMTVQMLNLWRF